MGSRGAAQGGAARSRGLQALKQHTADDLGHLGDYGVSEGVEPLATVGAPSQGSALAGSGRASPKSGPSMRLHPGGKPIIASTQSGLSGCPQSSDESNQTASVRDSPSLLVQCS